MSSVSNDPSENHSNMLICYSIIIGDQLLIMVLIINAENLSCLLNIFVKTVIHFFQDSLIKKSSNKQHLLCI